MRFPLFWLLILVILLGVVARAEENTTANKKQYNITHQQIEDWTNDLMRQPNSDCELVVTHYHRYCKINMGSECTRKLRNEYQDCNDKKLHIIKEMSSVGNIPGFYDFGDNVRKD